MGDKFGGDVDEGIGAEALFPIAELGSAVFEGALEVKGTVSFDTME